MNPKEKDVFREEGGYSPEEGVSNRRQQDKIIRAVGRMDFKALGESSVDVSPEERLNFLHDLGEGVFTEEVFDFFIRALRPPFENEEEIRTVYRSIIGNPERRRVFEEFVLNTYLKGIQPRKGEALPLQFLEHLTVDFPTPKKLEDAWDARINEALRLFEEEKDAERKRALEADVRDLRRQKEEMKGLEPVIYGKRYEYWNQVKLLQGAAEPFRPKVSPEGEKGEK